MHTRLGVRLHLQTELKVGIKNATLRITLIVY